MSPPGPWQVIQDVYIGTVAHARDFDGVVICVLNQWPWDGNPNAIWLPVVIADADNLDKPVQALMTNLDIVASLIDEAPKRVLVHCRQAQERSVLAVVWYMYTHMKLSLDRAYAIARAAKPDVMDRRKWLP